MSATRGSEEMLLYKIAFPARSRGLAVDTEEKGLGG